MPSICPYKRGGMKAAWTNGWNAARLGQTVKVCLYASAPYRHAWLEGHDTWKRQHLALFSGPPIPEFTRFVPAATTADSTTPKP